VRDRDDTNAVRKPFYRLTFDRLVVYLFFMAIFASARLMPA
jgi:hypothetical protein